MKANFRKMSFLDAICLSPKVTIRKGEDIPFVEMANVAVGNRKDPMAIEVRSFSGGTKFEKNDTVIASIEPCLQHGKSFYFSEHDKGAGSTEFLVFRKIDGVTTDQFVYYFMMSYEIRATMIRSMKGATGRQRVDTEVFTGMQINVPDIETQDRIAGILSDYDSAIANCRKQIALLEEAAMRLYREWFKDGKGEKKRIGDICKKIGSGGTPSRRNENFWDGGKIPWVKTGELQDCWIFDTEEKITAEGLSGSSAKMFPAETLMMAIYASPTLGRLGILDMPACCNQATLCLIADETVVSWQWLYCKLYELRDKFNAIARGAGQQNISGIVVKEYSVVVPERRKVESFTTPVASMFQQMRVMGKQIRTLTEARDRLLPKLMKGEIAV